MTDETDVRDIVSAINRAWQRCDAEALMPLFHEDVVMLLPGGAGTVQGRAALVESFREFSTNARVHDYREEGLRIDLFGATAIATYRFTMIYERDAGKRESTGRDLYVFERSEERWQAVYRAMFDLDERAASA